MDQNIWFGKYEVIRLIGVGASGQVYLARHLYLQQLRAIKRIPKDSVHFQQVLYEADILKSLNHPAIPVIYDVEEDEKAVYLVEEYIQGESLEAYVLHQNLISITFLLRIGMLLCDVFQYLHTCDTPIVYQDLKPEHIIVYGDQVKIVDFGIASFSDDSQLFQSYGTIRYAAPEKLLGLPVDHMTDVYGIGCVLQFLWEHLLKEQKTAALQAVIRKATATEKEKRYQNESDLKRDLKKMDQEKRLSCTKKIAVLSSQSGIGATHFAISCNVYFHLVRKKAIYVEENESGHMSQLSERVDVRFDRKTKRISHLGFEGLGWTGAGIQQTFPPECIRILDFGAYKELNYELETCDLIAVILGGQLWQEQKAMQCANQLRHLHNVLFLTNYGDEKSAKKYAGLIRKKVYCFPLDKDPFFVSAQKKQFFQKLLKDERW